jgi:hypothetical protein
MKKSQHLNKELRELNLCIFLSQILLFLFKGSTIQVLGLMIAALWSLVSYKITDTVIAAPFLFVAMYIFVRFYWIPTFTASNDVEEMEIDLIKYRKQRDEIRIQLSQN